MAKASYKYKTCNIVKGGLTTTSKSEAHYSIGRERFRNTEALVRAMLGAYTLQFQELGYDIHTIKFEISLPQ